MMEEIEWLFNKEEKKIHDGIVTYLNLKRFLLLDQDDLYDVISDKIYYYVYGKNRIPYIKINYHFYSVKLDFIHCYYRFSDSELMNHRVFKSIEEFRDFIIKNF